jgi:hypothetical protein
VKKDDDELGLDILAIAQRDGAFAGDRFLTPDLKRKRKKIIR